MKPPRLDMPAVATKQSVSDQTARLPVILTTLDWYLPGFRAGGPIKTLANITTMLAGEFRFRIITRHYDLGAEESYPFAPERWQYVESAEVFYVRRGAFGLRKLRALLNQRDYDVLYLNSVFSALFSVPALVLRRLGLVRRVPVVVATRGELAPGCLTIKPRRKAAYLALSRLVGLFDEAIWQASGEHEAADIRRQFERPGRSAVRVFVAPDPVLPPPSGVAPSARPARIGRSLAVAFFSRICRVKNLDGALQVLRGVSRPIDLNVYGPVEDAAYWRECQALADDLPAHVRVRMHGSVDPHSVTDVFASHDLLLLPTFGENFGHVIFEALSAGCPVLISDRTPWRDLARQQAGWDLPLDDLNRFTATLEEYAAMSDAEAAHWSAGARAMAQRAAAGVSAIAATRRLFQAALDAGCVQRGVH